MTGALNDDGIGIGLIERRHCPCCGGAAQRTLEACRDQLFAVPGLWDVSFCAECDSGWIRRVPPPSGLAALYPSSYSFIRNTDENPAAAGWRAKVKEGVLSAWYGYRGSGAWGVVGRLAGILLVRRAGFDVAFQPWKSGGHLVEVGPGNGAFLVRMREKGWAVTAVEPDAGACAALRRSGIETFESTIEAVDLPEDTYDAVVLHHAFEHLSDPAAGAAKLAGSMASGGRLVSISPNPRGLGARRFGRYWIALDVPRHLVLPSCKGYRAVFERAGLKVQVHTDARLSGWNLPASARLANGGEAPPRAAGHPFADWVLSHLPGFGEEVICIARKP